MPYLLESEGGSLSTPDGPNRQPLPLNASDSNRNKISNTCGTQEKGVIELDNSLHACTRHNRAHTLDGGGGGGGEGRGGEGLL